MSFFSDVERDLVVQARHQPAQDVVALDLVAHNGRDLPAWTPGSHIDLRLGDGLVRQYSLCSDPADRATWRVAVLREDGGRGGSVAAHQVEVGQRVRVRGPRNHFAFETGPGEPVVLLAGGIGVTAVHAMARAAAAAGADWSLHYAGRSAATMAFAGELVALDPARVHLYRSDLGERLDLEGMLAGWPAGTRLFACGPRRMMDVVERVGADWPAGQLCTEHFVAREYGDPVWPEPFEVELALSGQTVVVPPGRSVLDVLDEAGVLVPSSCREGTCGTCETPVLDGEVEHRDSVLTPSEKADSLSMMVCVSRAAGPRIVLDL